MSYIFEFLSGEKLIANLLDDTEIELIVESPFVIVPTGQQQAGQQTFGLIPWPYFKSATQKVFNLNRMGVLTHYVANDELDRYYTSNKSNLVLPPITQAQPVAKLITE